jgi:hypothetical protein
MITSIVLVLGLTFPIWPAVFDLFFPIKRTDDQ